MPEIDVDPDQALEYLARVAADAEAAEFAADARAARAQAAMETADSDPESWRTVADRSVAMLADHVCPAWELTADEKQMTSGAIAAALDEWFPGAVQGFDSWSPSARLVGVLFLVALPRFDLERMRFKPLHKTEKESKSDAETEPAGWPSVPHDGQDPERENAGHFTIGTGG